MAPESAKEILVVDDKPKNLRLLVDMLGQDGYVVRPVTTGKMALMTVEASKPDLILLDVDMPEMDGYEVCRRLKEMRGMKDVPVIFISALGETINKVQGFEAGGVDYVTKPFQIDEVRARVKSHLKIYAQKIKRTQQIEQVAHDVKTQLATIDASLQMIGMEDKLGESEREYIKLARSATGKVLNRMVEMIYEDEDEEQSQALSFNDFLIDVYNDLAIVARKEGLDFQMYLPEENAIAVFAPDKMRQVMHNLLSNAFKYTPSGGRIELRAEVKPDMLIISVADNGLGIPEDDLPRIFNKFYRIDTEEHRIVEGTGIGLSIVKSIVERHGGQIHVESEMGVGTTFYFTLPLKG